MRAIVRNTALVLGVVFLVATAFVVSQQKKFFASGASGQCGDDILNAGEQCERTNYCGEGLACSGCQCVPAPPHCGNGKIDTATEECDETSPETNQCPSGAACNSCFCGIAATESGTRGQGGGYTSVSSSVPYINPGGPWTCRNGHWDSAGEECDPTAVPQTRCKLTFCRQDCKCSDQASSSGPVNLCGNGREDPGEECGDVIWGHCQSPYTCSNCKCGGPLSGYCGNGKIDYNEVCDESMQGTELYSCGLNSTCTSACKCTTPTQEPHLMFFSFDGPSQVMVGDTFRFTLNVRNLGNMPFPVEINWPYNSHAFTLDASKTKNCVAHPSQNYIQCSAASLKSLSDAVFEVFFTAVQPTEYQESQISMEYKPGFVSDTMYGLMALSPGPLQVTLEDPGFVNPNEPIHYKATVTNTSNVASESLHLRLYPPVEKNLYTYYVKFKPSQSDKACDGSALRFVTCPSQNEEGFRLEPGETRELELVYENIMRDQNMQATVRLFGESGDLLAVSNSILMDTQSKEDLSMSITEGSDDGGKHWYDITVRNDGRAPSTYLGVYIDPSHSPISIVEGCYHPFIQGAQVQQAYCGGGYGSPGFLLRPKESKILRAFYASAGGGYIDPTTEYHPVTFTLGIPETSGAPPRKVYASDARYFYIHNAYLLGEKVTVTAKGPESVGMVEKVHYFITVENKTPEVAGIGLIIRLPWFTPVEESLPEGCTINDYEKIYLCGDLDMKPGETQTYDLEYISPDIALSTSLNAYDTLETATIPVEVVGSSSSSFPKWPPYTPTEKVKVSVHGPSYVLPGKKATYTVTLTNDKSDEAVEELTISLPSFAPSSDGTSLLCSVEDGQYVCGVMNYGHREVRIAPRQSKSYDVSFVAPASPATDSLQVVTNEQPVVIPITVTTVIPSSSSSSSYNPGVCGNKKLEGKEKCDDGNKKNGDGCQPNCAVQKGWKCVANVCGKACGDGVLDPGEVCDLGAKNGKDAGCRTRCKTQPGWQCQENFCTQR